MSEAASEGLDRQVRLAGEAAVLHHQARDQQVLDAELLGERVGEVVGGAREDRHQVAARFVLAHAPHHLGQQVAPHHVAVPDATVRGDVGLRAGEVEPREFGDADAVFGANAAAELSNEAKDCVVGTFVVGFEADSDAGRTVPTSSVA